jgi:hypothetical protein
VKVDRGDLLRTMPIAFRYLDTITPSLPVAAVMAYSGDSSLALEKRTLRRFAGIDVPVVDGKLLVNFRGPRGTFPTASLTSALALKPSAAGEAWRQSLRKGDIVVIGANVTGHPDVQATPVDESLPGPEFIATVIDNLLRGDARSRLPGWLNFLIPIVLGATVGLTAVLASRKRSALVLVLPLVLAYFGIVALAFANGLVLDVVTPFSGAALAYTGSALYLFNTEGKKRREIRQSFSRYLAPEGGDDARRTSGATAPRRRTSRDDDPVLRSRGLHGLLRAHEAGRARDVPERVPDRDDGHHPGSPGRHRQIPRRRDHGVLGARRSRARTTRVSRCPRSRIANNDCRSSSRRRASSACRS